MKRKDLNYLVEWKDKINRKPLIVWGARQVGKTYLIKDLFAEEYYKDKYIYIDFNVEDEIRELCDGTANAKKIINIISTYTHKQINKDTLLIFDEIQEYPNIVSSLKYFCQDFPEIPVIATGSMVRIKLLRESRKRGNQKNQFLFPVGKINQLTIYPLTFDEYLLNANEILYNQIQNAYQNKKPLEDSIHKLAMNELFNYLLVGGMPEAVNLYLTTNSLLPTLDVLKEIYDDYLADMQLYQASPESMVRSRLVFSKIFAQLDKESKNFSSGLLTKGSKTRDFRSPIEWLTLSHLVLQSNELKEKVALPLSQTNENLFRLYLADTGIFTYQSGINAASFLSKDIENKLSGIFYENYIACELTARGIDLYYWRGKNRNEIEFIVESNNDLYLIDAKKNRGSLTSVNAFGNHNSYKYAIKVSSNNFGFDKTKKLITIPFYYFSWFAEDLMNGTFHI